MNLSFFTELPGPGTARGEHELHARGDAQRNGVDDEVVKRPVVSVHAEDRPQVLLARAVVRAHATVGLGATDALTLRHARHKRRGERALEERHTQRIRDALGDEVPRGAMLGRHRHHRSVGR